MSKKVHRKAMRINGKLINSPRFEGKDAGRKLQEWYAEKLKEKDFIERGLLSSSVPTFMTYAAQWLQKRMSGHYPKSTWGADEQRLRAYLLPALSEIPMNRITRNQMRQVLINIQTEHKLSIQTRTRVKALASKIFTDAMNENPPHCDSNPCWKITFNDPRKGRKLPATLESDAEVMQFLKTAGECGPVPALICAIAVMAGLRKSEIIPLRYRNIKRGANPCIVVDCHVEQASMEIKPGTKAGSDEHRTVPVSPVLIKLIDAYRRESKHNSDDDFIFYNSKGDWIEPKAFHNIVDEVVKKFGRPITLHKLRHSYGRMAMVKGVHQKELQRMLGHKSSTTTDLYSELSQTQIASVGHLITYDINPAEESRLTPKRLQTRVQTQGNQHVKRKNPRS